jgi:DNA/RNA endonuclease YhcR with UshA esterase domain
MTHCPSCGRYVGPYEACPYCGAHLTRRIPIRVVKIAAILLATVGLAALWFAATRAQVPLIQIGQAGATMNMAYVRLEGHCTRAPSYDPESDYLSFWIEDDTGEIRVSAYRAETRQIIEQGRVPALGDLVEVAGTLRVREDFLSLTVNVPDQLEITRAEPVTRTIGTIAPEDRYLRVQVRGQVRQVYEPYEGLTLIIIRDETGSIPIAVSEHLIALNGITPTLTTGQPVEVVATVSLYGDTPQLVPASLADIVPLDQAVPIAVEKQIGELTAADAGQLAVVRGAVTEVNLFSSGVKFTLDDGTGAIVLLLWQSVYDALPDPEALDVGAEVRVQGEVSQYRGQLEVIPELAEDVQVLMVKVKVEVETRAIGDVTPADVGATLLLAGTLGEPEAFSAGVKFPLQDDTGTIVLLLWQNVYEAIPDTGQLVTGARVEVIGRIDEYRGELEIIPEADGIIITGAGPAPTPEPAEAAINTITPAQVGQVATIQGTLGEKETFSAGSKFELSDGTGTIILLLWQNVYDAIPDADRLVAGATVKVIGQIEEYRGALEIIPEADGVRVME